MTIICGCHLPQGLLECGSVNCGKGNRYIIHGQKITVINCAYTRTKNFNFPLTPSHLISSRPIFVYPVHPQHPEYFILSSQLTMATTAKPPVPPFTEETARIKVKAAQDVWNTKYTLIILSHSCHHIINETQKSPSSKECIYRRFHLEKPRYIYPRPR